MKGSSSRRTRKRSTLLLPMESAKGRRHCVVQVDKMFPQTGLVEKTITEIAQNPYPWMQQGAEGCCGNKAGVGSGKGQLLTVIHTLGSHGVCPDIVGRSRLQLLK